MYQNNYITRFIEELIWKTIKMKIFGKSNTIKKDYVSEKHEQANKRKIIMEDYFFNQWKMSETVEAFQEDEI